MDRDSGLRLRHGGATATGLVSLGLLVPTALAAPLGGPVIDRYGAGRVLAAAYAAQGAGDGHHRGVDARRGATARMLRARRGHRDPADGHASGSCGDVAGDRLRTLGRGEGFGEIGLIRNTERTASVTAMTDAVLLSIERGPFITAVTGHPESLQRADAIIDELLT